MVALPGQLWCGRCGLNRVPASEYACEPCRTRPQLEDYACGGCGQPASVMYVYGFRCRSHESVRDPSQKIGDGDRVVGCVGRLLRPLAGV